MSEVSTGAQDEDPMVRDVTQWLADNPATPADQGDFDYAGALGRVLRRGGWCFTPEGRSASALAFQFAVQQLRTELSAIMPAAGTWEEGYTAGELKWAEAMDKQIDIEENLRTQLAAIAAMQPVMKEAIGPSMDIDHFLSENNRILRTQLAASQADVARLREVLGMIEAIGDGSKTANSLPNIADIARAALKDTQP